MFLFIKLIFMRPGGSRWMYQVLEFARYCLENGNRRHPMPIFIFFVHNSRYTRSSHNIEISQIVVK